MAKKVNRLEDSLFRRMQKRPLATGSAVTLALLLVTLLFTLLNHRLYHQNELREVNSIVRGIEDRVMEMFAYSQLAAMTLSQAVLSTDTVPGFDSIASELLTSSDHLDAVQMVPKGIITQVFPLEVNRVVIGYDIMADPTVNKEAEQAIRSKRMFFAGPLELRQGGMAVVGRLPIYRNGDFWGFSAVIIRLERLLDKTGLENSGDCGYFFQLGKLNPNTGEEEFFLTPPVRPSEESVYDITSFPDAGWKVYVVSTDPNRCLYSTFLLLFVGVCLSLLAGYLTTALLERGNQLSDTHAKLAWQHREMRDSIHSARYLQQSVLQTEADVKGFFPDSFVIFEPRDAVSGDFLWAHGNGTDRLIAVVDCTGHGVSAALLSMIAGQLLYQTVVMGKEYSPARILAQLDEAVKAILQSKAASSSMDGMDMVICKLSGVSDQVTFAGANRPLYLLREGRLEELAGNRMAIGGHTGGQGPKVFDEHRISVAPGDFMLLCTDGYHSQFGGERNRKFGRKALRELFGSLASETTTGKADILKKRFNQWKGKAEQVDDVLIVGIGL